MEHPAGLPETRADCWEGCFKALAARSEQFISCHDPLYRFTYLNPRAARALSVDAQTAVGRTLREIGLSQDLQSLWQSALAAAGCTGLPQEVELCVGGPGTPETLRGSCFPAEEGSSYRLISMFTPQGPAAVAFPQEADVLQRFLDALPVVAYIKDADGHYVWANQTMQRMFGLPAEAWPGRTVFDIAPPGQAEGIRQMDTEIVLERKGRQVDFTVDGPDGRLAHRRSFRAPFVDRSGRWLLAGISLDITDWVKAEEDRGVLLLELEAQRESVERHSRWLALILDNLTEGVTVFDAEGRVVLQNRKGREMTGQAPSATELARLARLDGTPLDYPDGYPHYRAARGERTRDEEYILRTPGGRSLHVVANSTPLLDEQGSVRFVIDTYYDVTQTRRLERDQRELLRILSHDLRAPLSVVAAAVQMIAGHPDRPGFVRELAQRIASASGRMEAMIRDLVDSALLQEGRLGLRLERLNMCEFVRRVVRDQRGAMDVDRIELGCEEGRMWVAADPDRLARALLNLLSNALKYSAQDTAVRVTVQEREGEVVVEVRDRGIGVGSQDQTHLFEPYFRASSARAYGGGLGLGLYITKGLIEAHRGRVWIDSRVGEGTAAYLALPAAES